MNLRTKSCVGLLRTLWTMQQAPGYKLCGLNASQSRARATKEAYTGHSFNSSIHLPKFISYSLHFSLYLALLVSLFYVVFPSPSSSQPTSFLSTAHPNILLHIISLLLPPLSLSVTFTQGSTWAPGGKNRSLSGNCRHLLDSMCNIVYTFKCKENSKAPSISSCTRSTVSRRCAGLLAGRKRVRFHGIPGRDDCTPALP